MTIYYPDVASFQAGVSFHGVPAVCVKATEGAGYENPDYAAAKIRAAEAGAFFFAYHFLHQGNAVAQADYAHSIVGSVPLMLDIEQTGSSNPGVADTVAFVGQYRSLGGVVHLAYLPEWYWANDLGRPSLAPLSSLGLLLVSSNYTRYSDSGPGWAAYGGMSPTAWQYTSSGSLNGDAVDFNAFKGTVSQLESLATSGKLPAPGPKPYPAPAGLKAKSVSLAVEWTTVTASGKPVESYSVRAYGLNGELFFSETVTANSAVVTGLVPGWTYNILIWANGGPVAPPHATLKITV